MSGLGVTLRYGAGERSIIVDENVIDRNKLSVPEDKKATRMIREAAKVRGLTDG